MIDPRQAAVLIRDRNEGSYRDRTDSTYSWTHGHGRTVVALDSATGLKEYTFTSPGRVLVIESPARFPMSGSSVAEIRGELWENVTEVLRFDHPNGSWSRVFYTTKSGEKYRTYPAGQVRILNDASSRPQVARVLRYWQELVENLPSEDGRPHPTAYAYGSFGKVHPDSALARYLSGEPIVEAPEARGAIFPFASNLSQREALLQSLQYPISVIDGPPGTGKTQTILNVLATLVATPGVRVGVVSANNAAVDNVRDKLNDLGFGYLVAGLGKKEKKEGFFASQELRNIEVDDLVSSNEAVTNAADIPMEEELKRIEAQVLGLQSDQRDLARLRQDLDGHRLEQQHFVRYLAGHEVADLDGVTLLGKGSDRILEYLAETQLLDDRPVWPLRWLRRLRRFIRYGALGDVDPNDSAVVLELQRVYYVQKIKELSDQVARLEERLSRADLSGLVARQQDLSVGVLREGLRKRYAAIGRHSYSEKSYLQQFEQFSTDYPIILSTCHSLRRSIGSGRLLDYLIIDEASQVDLLAAGLAIASCKRVIVVGDLAQLPHIPEKSAIDAASPAPAPAYDYGKHSLLSSLQELYGDELPRTMLREHYRCDPAIIGFCNEKFYDRQLIPFTAVRPESRPLVLHTTVDGNHMRSHREGGRSNQREIDVIEQEVIPQHCEGYLPSDIGVTSPYRRQVSKINGVLVADLELVQADTVHRFQGREKKVVVMSTVLDETWRGHTGTQFVDDPNLVNVAISRAEEKFVLVTNHDMLPQSRNLRDLMEYIRYHDPDHQPHRSSIVSIFDLLYQSYSERLESLAAGLRGEMKYKSEDIALTVVNDLLAEERFRELKVCSQMIVQNLLPDLDGLTQEEATYVKNRCSLDFVIERGVTRQPVLAIEVNGFEFHENMADRRAKDRLKESIMAKKGIPLLSLPTTGSGEEAAIRARLEEVLVPHL